jgi:hypothetical protein
VPEDGGRRDRLGDEADEPDDEKPLSKVPHAPVIDLRGGELEGGALACERPVL